ncbi:hypothetical protein Pth03_04300 [Planotetraspora thailandica]|uniref:Resolvase/invertase-type recombinase catalytic domain-containing protein n=1 Tax=Planotetraspora thailandica TaxID=487172 RepID=A0A8J3XTW8_9ACTN|nr:recombinase family protein [Planotetraspora thailandica]GII52041.1 hypothetical protein Pth03_04300 [Planotetraspora thailandica]
MALPSSRSTRPLLTATSPPEASDPVRGLLGTPIGNSAGLAAVSYLWAKNTFNKGWDRNTSKRATHQRPGVAGTSADSKRRLEHKRLGRGIELATLAEELKASDVGLEFLTGELQGSHDPSGIVFTVLAALSGMEREYIRDRTLEGHESARKRGRTIGGAGVTDDDMLSMALHLREQEMSLRDIAKRLVITKGAKKGRHPSPATVLRMLRGHDEQAATATRRAQLLVTSP